MNELITEQRKAIQHYMNKRENEESGIEKFKLLILITEMQKELNEMMKIKRIEL